ncbi:MAG: hypothetical protein C4541_07050 [Candidatus Auribacter fodinae]|jgi:hypothetical protein|uniref:Uncharacterized protein n=1 Tax=Candidatus Auribacter fodinae TaxID=2093366 RepID=A0A3A4R1V1_9BACT|nr:MAG: hypothetical protein C4541_07050 [Candidatus Auribacter fodinae]
MKRLISLSVIALLASLVTAASAQINPIFTKDKSVKQASVEVNLTFEGDNDTNNWTIALEYDNDTPVSKFNSGTLGLNACGTRKVTVANANIIVQPKGAWEVVTYTNNFSGKTVPQNILDSDNDTKIINHIGQFSGVKLAIGSFTHYMPVKIRSEAIFGADTTYEFGDEIDVTKWDSKVYPDDAEFGFIPELEGEDYGAAPKILAQLGHPITDPIGISLGIDESTAGSGTYSGVVYFDLRGN